LPWAGRLWLRKTRLTLIPLDAAIASYLVGGFVALWRTLPNTRQRGKIPIGCFSQVGDLSRLRAAEGLSAHQQRDVQ
jgi:hypothetical protein